MSDNYHYEDGAKHYDHKKVLHIDSVGSGDIEKLISAFFKDGAEDAEVLEEFEDAESVQRQDKELKNNPHKVNPVVDAIKELTGVVKESLKTPKQQFTVYPQSGSTTNLGCDQKNSDFKTYLPGAGASEEQSMLESNKMGDEDV